jgi:hypothetical protein
MFVVINSIAAGIYFTLQSLGILPMFYQRIIIRVLETSILSGLTLLYYTSQEHKPYFAVFGGVLSVILLLAIIKNAYKQYEKSKDIQNNVLKKKIEELKLKRDQGKDGNSLPALLSMKNLWKSTRQEELFYEQEFYPEKDKENNESFVPVVSNDENEEEEEEDLLERQLQLRISQKKERKDRKEEKKKRRQAKEDEKKQNKAKRLLALEDLKYASSSFKPVAPQLQQDRDFLKSLDHLAALSNADYTPLNVATNSSIQPTTTSMTRERTGIVQSIGASSSFSRQSSPQTSPNRGRPKTSPFSRQTPKGKEDRYILSLDDLFDDNHGESKNADSKR